MTEQEKRDELRQKLTEAVTDLMRHNDLDTKQQLEVLAEMFLYVLRLFGEFNGQEHPRFTIERLHDMIATVDREYAEMLNLAMEMYLECEGEEQAEKKRRATTRPTKGDYSNGVAIDEHGREDMRYSWYMVFPAGTDRLLTLSDFLIWVNGKDDDFVARWFADTTSSDFEKYTHLQEPQDLTTSQPQNLITSKLNKQTDGIALTSMPEKVKKDLDDRLRELGFRVVAVDSPLLALVVFGNGRAATKKLPMVQQRIEAGESIVGMFFEDMQEVVRCLEQDPDSDLPF